MSEFRKLIDLINEAQRVDEFNWGRKPKAPEPTSGALADRMNAIATKPVATGDKPSRSPAPTPQAPTQTRMSRDLDRSERMATHVDHAPAIGIEFGYRGRTFQVVGYMKELRAKGMFGMRDGKLVACTSNQATWVIGMGGGGPGTVAPVSKIQPTGGKAKWSHDQMAKVQSAMVNMIDQKFTLNTPSTKG